MKKEEEKLSTANLGQTVGTLRAEFFASQREVTKREVSFMSDLIYKYVGI